MQYITTIYLGVAALIGVGSLLVDRKPWKRRVRHAALVKAARSESGQSPDFLTRIREAGL